MYNTVKEVHVAIEIGLQQIQSNRKQAFKPEHLDYVINDNILNLIEDKINPKSNRIGEGFEDSAKRYDDLRELKKNANLRCYFNNVETYYSLLPSNYYRLIPNSCREEIYYNNRSLPTTSVTESKTIYKITVPTITNNSSTTLTLNSETYVFTKPITTNNNSFELVNYMLSRVNTESLVAGIYWERYGDYFAKGCFIVVPVATTLTTVTMTGTIIGIVTTLATETKNYSSATYNKLVLARLISTKDKFTIGNHYTSNNLHTSPILEIYNNKVLTYYNPKFIPLNLNISYIKRPRKIDYYHGIMPDITIDYDLITKVVDTLKVFIKDEQAYNMFVNKINQLE